MAGDAWTRDELFEGLDPSQDFIAELERLSLIVVVGQDAQGGSLYAHESREELEKVLALVELGYQPEDIAAIARRVGLPVKRRGRFQKPPVHLTRGELAERAGVTPEQLSCWVDAGLIQSSFQRPGAGELYVADTVVRVQRFRDLEVLGVSLSELETWRVALDQLDTRRPPGAMTEAEEQAVEVALTSLHARLELLSDSTRRWRRFITTLKRRFGKRRSGKLRGRGKRRLRTRTRR